jgi:hypothetical protein
VRTPALQTDRVESVVDDSRRPELRDDTEPPVLTVETEDVDRGGPTPRVEVTVTSSDPSGIADLWLTANGDDMSLIETAPGTYRAIVLLDRYTSAGDAGPSDSVRLLTVSKDQEGNASADTRVVPTR